MDATKEKRKRKRHRINNKKEAGNTLMRRADWEKWELSEPTMNAIEEDIGFNHLTQNQSRAILPLYQGYVFVGHAKEGYGRTLAFMVTVVELVHNIEAIPEHSTIAIIICPTRNSAIQAFYLAEDLMKYHSQSFALIKGGSAYRNEEDEMSEGANILIATPDWLCRHLRTTRDLHLVNLRYVVIDGADRILEAGYKREMQEIFNTLPKEGQQTAFFSASLTKEVVDLVSSSCQMTPVYINMDNGRKSRVTDENLQISYSFVKNDKRFPLLYYLLMKNLSKKVMVFFSSYNSVKFHSELLRCFKIDCLAIEGEQKTRTTTFLDFCYAKEGVLLCTDVDLCGIDFPFVDWIVQYDLPNNLENCIRRLNQTTFEKYSAESFLFFLNDEEAQLGSYLTEAEVEAFEHDLQASLEVYESNLEDICSRQSNLVNNENSDLQKSAEDAFKSYEQAYHSHPRKDLFDFHKLTHSDVRRSFGLMSIPN